MALRTLFGLYKGKTKSGKDVLRGNLQRTLIVRGDDGNERVYPVDTFVMLLRNDQRKSDKHPEYSLLAVVDDDEQTYPSQQMVNHPQSEPITQQQSPPPANQDFGSASQTKRFHEHREAVADDSIPF